MELFSGKKHLYVKSFEEIKKGSLKKCKTQPKSMDQFAVLLVKKIECNLKIIHTFYDSISAFNKRFLKLSDLD